jgi:two-component system, LytTR family, response regulator
VNEIIRCQAESNYTVIYLKSHKITVPKTLKEFEELLTEYDFYRVHNSHLVNLAFVQNYNKEGFVTLSDLSKVEVSTRRKEEFLKRLSAR